MDADLTFRDPRALLRDAGLSPKKRLGQNFLVAESVARAIARQCIRDEEIGRARVIEIGAGTGVLTALLAERAREVVAIERDHDLVALLARELQGKPAYVLETDAQSVDPAEIFGEPEQGSPRVLCGNLPYAISGPLLRLAVASADAVDRVVFMLQDEVATRLTAAPGTKAWGALTVFVRAAFSVQRVLRVSPGSFHPPPGVTSAVVELLPLRPPRAKETDSFRSLVRSAFQARRKTLRNAWAGCSPDPDRIERAAARSNIRLEARGETLDVEAFARMAAALDEISDPP